MIDLHCHILPGVDDGPINYLEFIEMANNAVREGITQLVASPHHLNGQYENNKNEIIKYVGECNDYLIKENIPLVIHPGQELRIHHEIFHSLEKNEILTVGDWNKNLLLELPSGWVPDYTLDVVHELLLKGITPIIVHPERNKGFMDNHHLLYQFVENGALMQLTAGSIIGQFGKKIKSFSERIIEHQLSHFIASDAHNNHTRNFFLQAAYGKITETYGIHQTFYFKENAENLIKGLNITIEKPLLFRKKILGIF
ncbi:protein-tyrosine phosphatase [Cytobacillus eiseniae]|uniref:Tyrosine-protein phosphatase n=1 Tax=Cytobacillus eiseniae TaxID=762947 RepID=A0ABS4RG40_9BACI|nr:CpsB/CapC family capsule biosynthesis tyrosine phosphatase [Cytobacillus eiseniae]MBP2241869.1 protein-tyrosine phosphatase [Cytobacillus eiseniae]